MEPDELVQKQQFDELFEAHYMRLVRHALKFVDTNEDAEDVVEEVFYELWQNRNRIDFTDNISGYLFRATSSRSLNVLRAKGNTPLRIDMLEAIDELRLENLATQHDQSYLLEQDDLNRQLDRAIGNLPEKCREAFKLSYLHGLRNRDIAEVMEVSVRTVDAHIYKALRFLREKLAHLVTILCFFANFTEST